MTQILHVIPATAIAPDQYYLGSTKDIRGRTEYFRERNLPVDEMILEVRLDELLLERLRQIDVSKYSHIFIELPLYPRSIQYIRDVSPQTIILVRAINAELYHRIHLIRAYLNTKHVWRRSLGRILGRNVAGASESLELHKLLNMLNDLPDRLRENYRCAATAHYLLSIVDWETQNYWARFVDRSKLITLPYFLPQIYLKDIPTDVEKDYQCVCLMATIETPYVLDAANAFILGVTNLANECPGWRFLITGGREQYKFNFPQRIEVTGLLQSPLPLLRRSRSMAILSDFGFGFKTKILDAIACECYTLVTKNLYNRLPVEVRPYCVVVDPSSPESFRRALVRCQQPFPDGNANGILRNRAFMTLDRLFGI